MLDKIVPWFTHNAPSLALAALWVLTYFLRGNGRPKPTKRFTRPVTLTIVIDAAGVTLTLPALGKQEKQARLIGIRGPKLEVLAIGDRARAVVTEQRRPEERQVGILQSDLWQQLRAWPPPRKPVLPNAVAEVVVFDPFGLDSLSMAAIDAYLRYEVAVLMQGLSLAHKWKLRRGVLTLSFASFDKLMSEQRLALVKIVSQHVPQVAVNDAHFFRV